jgi:Uncharacterised protein family (UPF0236)
MSVKKNLTTLGWIEINNQHCFSTGNNGFQISSLMQEKIVYVGHLDCYQKSQEIVEKLVGVKVSASQIYRVTDVYGEQIGKTTDPQERTLTPVRPDETLYIEADGGMILTRKDDWKEVKVGRLFKSGDCIHADQKPGYISHSQYKALLGDSKVFCRQMEDLIDAYEVCDDKLIFISDGASWIKNWIEDAYPKATTILDYYHAAEHLHEFADKHFTEAGKRKRWTEKQKELILKSKVDSVIKNVRKLSDSKDASNLIDYYEKNKRRMDYNRYKQIGAGIIGSGAIESAHRTVVQKRMKLSGQRWSAIGAQNMLHLRVASMNGRWDKIIALTKCNFKHAA